MALRAEDFYCEARIVLPLVAFGGVASSRHKACEVRVEKSESEQTPYKRRTENSGLHPQPEFMIRK